MKVTTVVSWAIYRSRDVQMEVDVGEITFDFDAHLGLVLGLVYMSGWTQPNLRVGCLIKGMVEGVDDRALLKRHNKLQTRGGRRAGQESKR
jgi:hypothetical protein